MADVHLGLIAGTGPLPRLVAESRRDAGEAVTVVALNAEAADQLADFAPTVVSWAKPGRMEAVLKQAGCTHVTLAGQATRPDFAALKPDLKGVKLLPKVIAAARGGDGALLNLLITEFEKAGFAVCGAHDWLRGHAAAPGHVAGPAPSPRDRADLAKAAALVKALGPYDVGQGCVVCDGVVLAVEAAEGTDAMLARVAGLPTALRGDPKNRRGVLWKAPKSIQDDRADMPVVGAQTLRGAAAAGLQGVGVAAGGALILERREAGEIARREGVFLTVLDAAELARGSGEGERCDLGRDG